MKIFEHDIARRLFHGKKRKISLPITFPENLDIFAQ